MTSRIDPSRPSAAATSAGNAQTRTQLSRLHSWLKKTVPYYETHETKSLAGAVTPDLVVTEFTISSSGDQAFTLAAAAEDGQYKVLHLKTKSAAGNAVVTPANFHQSTTITLNTAGDSAVLCFVDGKWAIFSNQGCTVA